MHTHKNIAQNKNEKIKSISIIWLVPIVAVLIGAWMFYFQLSHQGYEVTISFDNGEGIEAGKTKIKVKSVLVGVVESIELNNELNGVVVNARIHNNDKNLLLEDSNFWVVRTKIGNGGITGLSTLVSGAYIELSPGTSTTEQFEFIGLENAPVTPAGSPGLHITLSSNGEHAQKVGDVILFRGIKVGRIEYVHFNAEERTVYYDAFIETPYDALITRNTKFWEVNGIEVNVSASGIRLQSGTLETLISGGVMFDVPEGMPYGDVVTQREEFIIFPNKDAIDISRYKNGIVYMLLFKNSIRGLKVGTPVEFRGVKVGRVIRTDIEYSQILHLLKPSSKIPVLITIDPTRIGYGKDDKSLQEAKEDILNLLQQGLHARIETGNILTGSKFISLQYKAGLTRSLKYFGDYMVIPTLGDQFEKIFNRFSVLLNKINNLPLDEIFHTTDQSLQQANITLKEIGQTSAQLKKLLKQSSDENMIGKINAVLINMQKLAENFSAGSPTSQELNNSLNAMKNTLNELTPLLMKLNKNPNSLIFEHPQENDIEPKGKQ